MQGLLPFLFIGFEILRLIYYHRRRNERVISAVRTLQHTQSSNPTYETCKITGNLIITGDYSKGLFYYLISPCFEDILAVFPPSTPDCVSALRWSPEGIQFLAYAALIVHLLGTETGAAFVYQGIAARLEEVSSLQQHDIEKLLKCIQEQLRIQSRVHDSRVAQLLPEEVFSSDISIETSGFGEVNFEMQLKN
ncbi:hypothetical protein VE03_10414, partial [Pseudogymnoascus sp. 23342-1-I1]